MNAVEETDQHLTYSGRDEGYRLGYTDGYRIGGCEAIVKHVAEESYSLRNMKVVYVPQGFDAIDLGVSETLRHLVKVFVKASADEMLTTVKKEKPDLVLVMNGLHVFPPTHHDHLDQIRKMGIKTAIWFADDPYFTDDTASNALHYDYVFTHEQNCVAFYQTQGCSHVYYLPLAMTPLTFHPKRVAPKYVSDVCFIGNAFWNRVTLFDALAPYLATKKTIIAGGHWDRLSSYSLLQDKIVNGWVPIEETANYYNGAKIVINVHRPHEAGSDNRNGRNITGCSINPRTYEIAGCGTLQITDIRQDLTSYYRPGYDIETFTSPDELQEKIEFYLQHEEERRTIALRSLKTTRSKHSYTDRLKRLLEVVRSK
ncbi:spore maturation protein [Paenibacillus selenitireducens]|uniref:Spore maturation protein n=1 Tax=Paenibacillus selenitireducens TaxID=1324314 RepID=A0A1T2XKB6_9BACL|nr:spore maturation protein [Paenibacillus selenitireducens]